MIRFSGLHAMLAQRVVPICLVLSVLGWGSLGAPALVSAAPSDLDPSFDGDGLVSLNLGGHDVVNAVTIQADGKIIAAGGTGSNGAHDVAIIRFAPDGSLDSSFGTGGVAVVDFAGGDDVAFGVAVQTDGKIVAAGHTSVSGDYRFAALRLDADGSLDTGFGTGGKVITDFGGFDIGQAMLLQSDGRIVVAGEVDTGSGADYGLLRYNADGSLDTGFGTGGKVETNIDGPDTAVALTLQSDGKIVAAGASGPAHVTNFSLARYNTDGSLDTGFGIGGKVTTDFGSYDVGRSVVIQGAGKLVVAGNRGLPGAADFALARYDLDGSLDTGFGAAGKVTTDFGQDENGHAVAVQANGKLVVAGYRGNAVTADSALARYLDDGSLDTDFDGDGRLLTDAGSFDVSLAMTLQTDGRIVTGGYKNGGSANDWSLARYLGDPTIITADFASSADSYVRQGANDTNEGASTFLRLQSSGNNRALVRFDQAAIDDLVGDGTVLAATLEMTISFNGNNWGSSGRTVDAHRLTTGWAEGNGFVDGNQPPVRGNGSGATWNCAVDSNVANQARDCSGPTEWEMGKPDHPELHPWVEAPTDSVTISNAQSGVVEWDVTADVAAFLSGSEPNYGWIIKKALEGQAGHVEFGSRETANGPRLLITWE